MTINQTIRAQIQAFNILSTPKLEKERINVVKVIRWDGLSPEIFFIPAENMVIAAFQKSEGVYEFHPEKPLRHITVASGIMEFVVEIVGFQEIVYKLKRTPEKKDEDEKAA